MEPGYAMLLRAAWQLWWRYWVVTVIFWALLALPVLLIGLRYPLLWDAWRMSRATNPVYLGLMFLVYNLLVCYPLAVRWLRRAKGAVIRPDGFAQQPHPSRKERERQGFLLSWAIFWMPFLWDAANLLLMGLLAGLTAAPERLTPALLTIAFNTALVDLFAMLPWNVRWALRHAPFGARWTLSSGV